MRLYEFEGKNLFKKFTDTGILIIGDLMVDRYIWGTVNRISPEAPVPVVDVSDENLTLGGAANVAHNITSLGGKVFIAGVIGDDNTGKILTGELSFRGCEQLRNGRNPRKQHQAVRCFQQQKRTAVDIVPTRI